MTDEAKPEEKKFNAYIRNDRKSTFKEAWEDISPSVDKPGSYKTVKTIARKYYKKEQSGFIDSQTQLLNKPGVLSRLDAEINRSARNNTDIALFYLDLNNLKEHNDNLGHEAGNKLLESFATILKSEARPTDIVGRIGGDEFIVALPDTTIEQAIAYWNRVQDLIKSGTNVWVSAGLTKVDIKNRDKSIEAADAAMYKAKNKAKEGLNETGIRNNTLKIVEDPSNIQPAK